MSRPLNLKITATSDGFLATSDSRKPAPEFASMLHGLANPCPYGGSTDPDYRRAVDRIAELGRNLRRKA